MSNETILADLGESIEHTKRKYHVHPPRDPAKWAAACCGIIRHYNAGWANGFKHGIVYWEIWNEPENRPAMWTGSDEQFLELYAVAAAVLGGCSLRGGEGGILGIFVGTAMIQLLRNIVNLQGIESSLEFVVMGGVIMIAVSLDQILSARRKAREARIDVKAASAEPTAAVKN